MNTSSYKKFTDSGFILLGGASANTSADPRPRAVLWHPETGSLEIPKPAPGTLNALDVNDLGEVVGGFVPARGGNQIPFEWSLADGFRFLTPPSGMTGHIVGYRNNVLGDVLLQGSSGSQVVSAVIDHNGGTFTTLQNNFIQPRFTAINNFREILGVYLNPATGLPSAFLRFPGIPDFATDLDASYPDLFGQDSSNTSFASARMNDFGEFGCDFSPTGNGYFPSQFYFFDGEYHSFRKPGDSTQRLSDVTNSPQILFTAFNGSTTQSRLASNGHTVPLSAIHPTPPGTQAATYLRLNEHGQIFGYGRSGYGGSVHHPFILSPDQDADNDGLADDWESYYGLNPNSRFDANADLDGDGFSNLAEFKLRRDPTIAEIPSATTGQIPDLRPGIDTDGHGMPNMWEVVHGLDWEDPADAPLDPDRDGFSNLEEFRLGTDPHSSPKFQVVDLPVDLQPAGGGSSIVGQASSQYFGKGDGSHIGPFVYQWEPARNVPGGSNGESVLIRTSLFNFKYVQPRDSAAGIVVGSAYHYTSQPYAQTPAYWDENGTHWISPTSASGSLKRISSDGRYMVGIRRIANQDRPFVHDKQLNTTTDLPLGSLVAVPWGNFAIHSQGYILAPVKSATNVSGIALWSRNSTGTWVLQVQVPKAISSECFLSTTGPPLLAGTVTHSDGKQHLFTWRPSVGYIDHGTAGGTEARVRAMSENGTFAGNVMMPIPNTGALLSKAFVSRPVPGTNAIAFDLLETPGPVGSQVRSVNDHGEILGLIQEPSGTVNGLWRGTATFHPLAESIQRPGGEVRVNATISINNQGEILAGGLIDGGPYRTFILQPDGDTDDDGIPDYFENQNNLNPFDASDGNLDSDLDGLSNLEEFRHGTNPALADTDSDGMPDEWEIRWGLDALDPTNANQDPDLDHVSNLREFQIGTVPTGRYELSTLEIPAISGQTVTLNDRHPVTGAYLLDRRIANRARPTITGPGNTLTDLPPLATGKNAFAKKWRADGNIIGYAYDANNRQRLVRWNSQTPGLAPVAFLPGSSTGYQYVIDVSENGTWILAKWHLSNGTFTTGAINLTDINNPLIYTNLAPQSGALGAGQSLQWTRIRNNGILVGTHRHQAQAGGPIDLNVVEAAPSFYSNSAYHNHFNRLLPHHPIHLANDYGPSPKIVGNIEQSYRILSIQEWPSYYGSGDGAPEDTVRHFLLDENLGPLEGRAVLLNLPEVPSFQVNATDPAGSLVATQHDLSYRYNKQGSLRLDALRTFAPGTQPPVTSTLPSLAQGLGTTNCRPSHFSETGVLSGLVQQQNGAYKIWTIRSFRVSRLPRGIPA